jgi:hypothetical protein
MEPTKKEILKNDYKLKLIAAHESAKQALKKLGELIVADQAPGPFHLKTIQQGKKCQS